MNLDEQIATLGTSIDRTLGERDAAIARAEAAEATLWSAQLGLAWARETLDMVPEDNTEGDYARALHRLMQPAEKALAESQAREAALREAAGDVQRWLDEATECPSCGNDGCSAVDSENNHVAGDRCARLRAALDAAAQSPARPDGGSLAAVVPPAATSAAGEPDVITRAAIDVAEAAADRALYLRSVEQQAACWFCLRHDCRHGDGCALARYIAARDGHKEGT